MVQDPLSDSLSYLLVTVALRLPVLRVRRVVPTKDLIFLFKHNLGNGQITLTKRDRILEPVISVECTDTRKRPTPSKTIKVYLWIKRDC